MVADLAMGERYSKDERWARRPGLANIMIEPETIKFQVCHKLVFVGAVVDDVVKVLCITVLERDDHSFDKNREVAQVLAMVND